MKKKFFDLAKIVSLKSKSHPQMGCVIVKKNRVINFGFNSMDKTHPRCPTHGNFLHAEIHAILGSSKEDLKGSSIYVFRALRNGELALAKPCSVCAALIREVEMKVCYYTTSSGYDSYSVE